MRFLPRRQIITFLIRKEKAFGLPSQRPFSSYFSTTCTFRWS